MIINDPRVLLYIEPTGAKSAAPIIDEITIKLFYALLDAINGKNTGCLDVDKNNKFSFLQGCVCDVESSDTDYVITDGPHKYITNYLCVHYVAYHRSEVLANEIEKIKKLTTPSTLSSNMVKYHLYGYLNNIIKL